MSYKLKLHENIKKVSERNDRLKILSERIWDCVDCHNKFKYRQLYQGVCVPCQEKRLEVQRKEIRNAKLLDLTKYSDKLDECTTGVCDMLHLHHDKLKDDPEHLQTSFIIGLVCGDKMKEKYLSKSMEKIY